MKHYLVLGCLVGGLASHAASDTTFEEILVVGRLEETIALDLERYGNRVAVITADDIAVGGFDDLSQSLQMLVPGLYLAPKNGAFDYMNCSLQGSRCQDILWLIDGVRINNRLYNTTAPLDTVPAHMIERVEVLYGGQGIFYGTQSVAGVVNIVTRAFSDRPTGSIGLGFDENDGTHVNAEYRTQIGAHQIVAYGSLDDADGFQPFRSSDYQPSGTDRDRGYEVRTIGIKYAFDLSPTSRLSLHYLNTENEVEWASPANRARSFNERDENLVTAKWDFAANENVHLYLKGYFHEWDSHWTRIDNELVGGMLTGNTIVVSAQEFWGYEDYGLNALARIVDDRGIEYSVGYDHQRYSGRDDVLLIADETESVNAIFAQVRTTDAIWSNTQLALGARYNRPSGDGDITVWNLSAKHAFTPRVYARGSLGTSFRFPDAWQLYGNDPCCTLGNPDLEGEESRNVNAALGGRLEVFDGLGWEVIVFAREVDNLIGSAGGVRVNTGNTVDFDGWEIALDLAINELLNMSVDYVRTDAEADGSSEQITDVPERIAKANVRYRTLNSRLELSLSIANVGKVYDAVSGGIGRVEHGGYTVVDLGGTMRFGLERRHRVGIRLENLTDERYGSSLGRAFRDADGTSYPYTNLGTPRTWHATYSFVF